MRIAVVTVGDELLSGDTENTNAQWLCKRLAERGVDVERAVTVPDRLDDIASVVAEYHVEYDAVIVTGGLGPTHDDLTMEAVAASFGRELETHAGAMAYLTEHGGYSAKDISEGTADLPHNARFLPNETGVAPGAVVDGVYVFPGVPSEMKAMFENVAGEFSGAPKYTETVHADEPESALVDRLVEAQEEFDVSIGSYPGDGVEIKVTAGDAEEAERAAAWLRERVERADARAENETA